jgi:hypothetical protein
MSENISAGDVLPSPGRIIEVRVPELRRLFNSMDPSPFSNRDLGPSAENHRERGQRAAARCAARLAGTS